MVNPSLEEDAQRLITARQDRYEAEWAEADLARAFCDAYPDKYLRAVCQVAGISHREVYRRAEYARLVPPDDRAMDLSPRYQVSQAKRAGDL